MDTLSVNHIRKCMSLMLLVFLFYSWDITTVWAQSVVLASLILWHQSYAKRVSVPFFRFLRTIVSGKNKGVKWFFKREYENKFIHTHVHLNLILNKTKYKPTIDIYIVSKFTESLCFTYYWLTASIKPRLLFSRVGYASWGLSPSSV